jgi:hypothetical protein
MTTAEIINSIIVIVFSLLSYKLGYSDGYRHGMENGDQS